MKAFDELVVIMKTLREKCPWDREQDLGTLRKFLIEEAYESLEALQNYLDASTGENLKNLKEELGDLLLQILFQSKILQEIHGGDPLEELMLALKDKLVKRHPHVFGDNPQSTQSADAVYQQWNKIKESEKKPIHRGILDGVSKTSPAMLQSLEIGKRSHKVGFDWIDSREVWDQVERELVELKRATTPHEKEDEWADLVFSLIQWARFEGIDPEIALSKMNQRFRSRFEWMEKSAKASGKDFKALSRDEKELLWKQAKQSIHIHDV